MVVADPVVDRAGFIQHYIIERDAVVPLTDVISIRLWSMHRWLLNTQKGTEEALIGVITDLCEISPLRVLLPDMAFGQERPADFHPVEFEDSLPDCGRAEVSLEFAFGASQNLHV